MCDLEAIFLQIENPLRRLSHLPRLRPSAGGQTALTENEARVLLTKAPVSFTEATVSFTEATVFLGATALAESKATEFLGAATLTVNTAALTVFLRP